MGVTAMLEAADLVVSGKHQEIVQDESLATYEGWFRADESRIHWTQHVDQVYNLIRACNPAPGAWCEINEQRVFVYDCRKHTARTISAVRGKPGQIVEIGAESIFVNAQGGTIEILRVRPQDGKKISAAEYAQQTGLTVDAFAR
jgi:methionyl-tRNA formyltransferase